MSATTAERNPVIFVATSGGNIGIAERPRFVSPRRLVAATFNLTEIETARVTQEDSLNRDNIFRQLLPNTIAVSLNSEGNHWVPLRTYRNKEDEYIQAYTVGYQSVVVNRVGKSADGRYYSANSQMNPDALDAIQRMRTLPKQPYVQEGERHVTDFEVGTERPVTVVDFSLNGLIQRYVEAANVLKKMRAKGVSVAIANNCGPYALAGRNGQSMLLPHNHMLEMGTLTPVNVRTLRNQRWDDGLSRSFGVSFAETLNSELLPSYGREAEVQEDDMGVTAEFSNFRPEDIGTEDFVKFISSIYENLKERTASLHEQLFTSKYSDVGEVIDLARQSGEMTPALKKRYDALFTLREDISEGELTEELKVMRNLHDEKNLKVPPAVVLGFLITPDNKMIAAFTPVYRADISAGPSELFGTQIHRMTDADHPGVDKNFLLKIHRKFAPPLNQVL